MKYSLDTNVIISHFKADRFSDDTGRFFSWAREYGHELLIADIVYGELYTGIFLSEDPLIEERRMQKFLAVNEIEVKIPSIKTAKRAGELYSNHLRRNKKTLKRILPDFIIGAHAEKYSDALITWNPADYKIDIPVITPVDVMEKEM
jgi:predicted nucleic acid-binding protein